MTDLDEALELLQTRARNDPELAAALRTVLGEMLARLPESEGTGAGPEPAPAKPEPEQPAADALLEDASSGGALPSTVAPTFTEWPELGGVARNLQLKAAACRWVAEHGYTVGPRALAARFALLDDARELRLYLWMFDLNRVNPNKDEALRTLAELFELTAQTLTFWLDAGDTPEERAAASLLADVQAAVRAAAWELAGYSDPDQRTLYQGLKLSAQASGSYLPQLNPSYRPRPLHDLAARLELLGETRHQREVRAQLGRRLHNKARYHIGLVAKNSSDTAQWRKVDEAVGELLALGQGEATQNLLAPLRGLSAPPELPELAALLAAPSAPSASRAQPAPVSGVSQPWSGAVGRVKRLLAGREILIVGGDERREATEGLETAFACPVRWLKTAPHTSLSLLEPAITAEVAVVLLLIRWSSHVYGELAHVCKERGVPLVRLAGGYNPNRVAHDVLAQAASRLRLNGPNEM